MSLQYQNYEGQGNQEPDKVEYAPAETVSPPYYTYVLIASIVAVSAAQLGRGLEESIVLAGFDKPQFVLAHEYWRILTGAALHGGLLHLFMNGYALLSFGRLTEMLSNRAHLAIVFLLAALGGGLLSLWAVPDGTSVGASGGILGLLSYLAVYAFRRRQFISPEFRKSLLMNIGFIIVFGLVLFQVIDNYGHIGGLIIGAVYGLIQIPSDEYVDPRKAGSFTEVAGIAALGVYIATALFSIWLLV